MYDGYVLFCNNESQQECLSQKRYTCLENQPKPLEEIKANTVIFLYNTQDKSLVGPFTALPEGDELDAGTWTENVDKETPFDDIQVTWEDLHILQNAPEKLPFLAELKTCKLSSDETQRLLNKLREGQLYAYSKKRQ